MCVLGMLKKETLQNKYMLISMQSRLMTSVYKIVIGRNVKKNYDKNKTKTRSNCK